MSKRMSPAASPPACGPARVRSTSTAAVDPGAAIDVIAAAASEAVRAGVADQRIAEIRADNAFDGIEGVVAMEPVIAAAAEEMVVALVAEEGVVAAKALDPVMVPIAEMVLAPLSPVQTGIVALHALMSGPILFQSASRRSIIYNY